MSMITTDPREMFGEVVARNANSIPVSELEAMHEQHGTEFTTGNGAVQSVSVPNKFVILGDSQKEPERDVDLEPEV